MTTLSGRAPIIRSNRSRVERRVCDWSPGQFSDVLAALPTRGGQVDDAKAEAFSPLPTYLSRAAA